MLLKLLYDAIDCAADLWQPHTPVQYSPITHAEYINALRIHQRMENEMENAGNSRTTSPAASQSATDTIHNVLTTALTRLQERRGVLHEEILARQNELSDVELAIDAAEAGLMRLKVEPSVAEKGVNPLKKTTA